MHLPTEVKKAFEAFDRAAMQHGARVEPLRVGEDARLAAEYGAAKDQLFKALNAMRRNDRRREK